MTVAERDQDSVCVSPNAMLERGKEIMLDGRDPASEEDWVKLVSFWAHVTAKETQPGSIQLLCVLYDVPLSAARINIMCALQALCEERRKEDESRRGTQRSNISTD